MSDAQPIPLNTLEPLDPAHTFKEASISDDGQTLTARTIHDTDWWRIPSRDAHDGPVLGVWRDVPPKGFEIEVQLQVKPETQVSLFLYFSPAEWCKASLEFDDGKLWIGPVVCNPYSDCNKAHFTLSYTPETQSLRIFHDQMMIREVHAFGPGSQKRAEGEDRSNSGPNNGKVFVGVMACSPKGDKAEVSWTGLAWKEGARIVH